MRIEIYKQYNKLVKREFEIEFNLVEDEKYNEDFESLEEKIKAYNYCLDTIRNLQEYYNNFKNEIDNLESDLHFLNKLNNFKLVEFKHFDLNELESFLTNISELVSDVEIELNKGYGTDNFLKFETEYYTY